MLTRLFAALALASGVLAAATAAPAVADDPPVCVPPAQIQVDQDGNYSCTVVDEGGDDGNNDPGDGGGTSEPTCELWGQFTFCYGTTACRNVPWHPPWALPEGPKPHPDSEPMIRECDYGVPGALGPYVHTIYWSDPGDPQPPSLYQQALTAIGQIDLTIPSLETSPSGRTLIYVPVWYWLDPSTGSGGSGANGDRIGTSAFGLVATAVLDRIEVDPGDGSGSFDCPWVTTAEQAEQECSYSYDRASTAGTARWNGQPAHLASVTAVWNLSFEINGTPVTIPNAPATLTSEASTAPVRVDEQGSVVTDVR